MTRTKHDPNGELIGQGIANIVSPFFGGFASTGAIARTATNIRAGAHSPIAAVVHALFLLASVLVAGELVGYLPMASLAALLLVVAWNMSELRHFVHILRVAPMSDVLVLLCCFALTVVFDMVVSVTAGVVLAALLFIRRMAELTQSNVETAATSSDVGAALPQGVVHYEIAGPLFFGAAEQAVGALDSIASSNHVLILDLELVPAMDITGLVALESMLARLDRDKTAVVVYGLRPQPEKLLSTAGLLTGLTVCPDFEAALAFAKSRA